MNILKGVKLLYYCLDVVIGFILREKTLRLSESLYTIHCIMSLNRTLVTQV